MTSGTTVVGIANRALLSVGSRSNIASLQESSTEANAISVLFSPTFTALARTAPWACLRAQVTLTLLAAAAGTPENVDGETLPIPPTPFLYQYAYPSSCLQVRYILPSFTNSTVSGDIPISPAMMGAYSWVPGSGQIPFVVAYATDANDNPIETILCNTSQAQCVFSVNQQNPGTWDSLLEAAMVASLAAYLVPALSLDLALMDRAIKQAEAAISNARTRDANEGVTSMDRMASWMQARVSGGDVNWASGYGAYNGWDSMAWPGA